MVTRHLSGVRVDRKSDLCRPAEPFLKPLSHWPFAWLKISQAALMDNLGHICVFSLSLSFSLSITPVWFPACLHADIGNQVKRETSRPLVNVWSSSSPLEGLRSLCLSPTTSSSCSSSLLWFQPLFFLSHIAVVTLLWTLRSGQSAGKVSCLFFISSLAGTAEFHSLSQNACAPFLIIAESQQGGWVGLGWWDGWRGGRRRGCNGL